MVQMAVGVDTGPVKIISDVFTASFFAGKDRINGQIALFYPGAIDIVADGKRAGLAECHGYRESDITEPDYSNFPLDTLQVRA